jgi:DNA-binding response OmpR family regulator
MARLLLIDDDPSLLEALTLAFTDAGHDVVTAEDGAAGERLARTVNPALIVTDVNMPLLDGFALCRKLRAAGNDVPMILLTSRDSDIDEALGLDVGADDYVSKPFNTRVLLARIAALLRRAEARAEPAPRWLTAGQLTLSPERLEARYAGTPLQVTVTEFRLLECLARTPGAVLSRARLLDLLRGDTSVEARLVDTYVRRLRRKFEAIDANAVVIETVIGAGYRLSGGE